MSLAPVDMVYVGVVVVLPPVDFVAAFRVGAVAACVVVVLAVVAEEGGSAKRLFGRAKMSAGLICFHAAMAAVTPLAGAGAQR